MAISPNVDARPKETGGGKLGVGDSARVGECVSSKTSAVAEAGVEVFQ